MLHAHLTALLMLTSCQARTFDCGVVDVEAVRVLVADEYPDAVEVFDRIDIYCVDDTDTFQTCARADYAHTEGCTAWVGSPTARGKMFVDNDEGVVPTVMHEAQHWHLMLTNHDDGCPSHKAACGWER